MATQQTQPAAGGTHTVGNPDIQRQSIDGGSAQAERSSMSDVKDAARRTGEEVKDQAQSAADALRQRGESFFQEQKGRAANELTTLSSAIRGAADRLRSDDESHTARYADMAADKLENVARFVGQQDLGSLAREVERAARRRPELFLGGMFLVGMGISRFLKASRNDSDFNRERRPQDAP